MRLINIIAFVASINTLVGRSRNQQPRLSDGLQVQLAAEPRSGQLVLAQQHQHMERWHHLTAAQENTIHELINQIQAITKLHPN